MTELEQLKEQIKVLEKKVEKKGNFQQYDDERINFLGDNLSYQMIWKQND